MAIPTKTYGINKYAAATGGQIVIESALGGSAITFDAFVTEFSQTFDSTWNQEEVYGRVDPIASFQGTKRSISLALSLPAGHLDKAGENYDNCRKLMQMLYPGYFDVAKEVVNQEKFKAAKTKNSTVKADDFKEIKSLGKVISKAPLVRLKFANLIQDTKSSKGLLGFFTSITWTPQVDMGFFTSGSKLYPKVINLSFSFSVLHEHSIGWNSKGRQYNRKFPFG